MTELSFEISDRDERGVSPVIGVILMVAITVILAAVIASFVLGFGDQVSQSVQAGADVSENDDGTATVTWIQEGNADHLNVSAGGNSTDITQVGNTLTIQAGGDADAGEDDYVNVGSGGTYQVTVVAVGSGGTRTVIAQEEVEIDESA
jgi:flagellin-like protein